MFGFVVGAVCLYLLVRTVRGGRWAHAGGPWMGGGWDGRWHGRSERFSGRSGSRGPMRWLFQRMETSPGQERVISEAADALRDTLRGWRDDAAQARTDVARSIRGEAFDGLALDEAFARAEARMATLRDTLKAQAARVHEALDSQQRAELADLLASGWRRRWA
jgi:Heavy-metal resistance